MAGGLQRGKRRCVSGTDEARLAPRPERRPQCGTLRDLARAVGSKRATTDRWFLRRLELVGPVLATRDGEIQHGGNGVSESWLVDVLEQSHEDGSHF